jgi:hypothetical protein
MKPIKNPAKFPLPKIPEEKYEDRTPLSEETISFKRKDNFNPADLKDLIRDAEAPKTTIQVEKARKTISAEPSKDNGCCNIS